MVVTHLRGQLMISKNWSIHLLHEFEQFIAFPDNNGCRRWLGPLHKGYGRFRYDRKDYVAHKLALCIKEDVPYVPLTKMEVKIHAAHGCFAICGEDHPWCVEHVSWLTYKEHGLDHRLKGTWIIRGLL